MTTSAVFLPDCLLSSGDCLDSPEKKLNIKFSKQNSLEKPSEEILDFHERSYHFSGHCL